MEMTHESKASESRNLSFAEFEWFVDISCLKLDDHQKQFLNQAQDVNRFFAQVGNNDRKCEEMNRNLLFHQQVERITQLNLSITNKMLSSIEEKTRRFELGDYSVRLDMHELDQLRCWIYPLTVNLNELLNMQLSRYEAMVLKLPGQPASAKRDLESVERILDTQLKHLEHLERMLMQYNDRLEYVRRHPIQVIVIRVRK